MAYADEDIIDVCRRVVVAPANTDGRLVPITRGGSDRSYYRVSVGDKTLIFLRYNPEREENHYHIPIARFLDRIGLRVPAILMHDPQAFVAVMEDVGDADLWSYRSASWDDRRPLYEKTLTMIGRLHLYPPEAFAKEDIAVMKGFDSDLYRWEQDYFREHFLMAVCHIDDKQVHSQVLMEELDRLSARLLDHEKRLIHRDFQSQNVMIFGNEPVFIDFQGMRFGNPLYDLGSLLYDPYVDMTDDERLELLSFYYKIIPDESGWDEFRTMFYEASVQRLMQALGAYGFLGLKRGRTAFLEHIPRGVAHLISALSGIKSLPILYDTVRSCRTIIGRD
jgi:N-acetylmuramate 1-kinase